MNKYYWRIFDGRVWGFQEACWLYEIPAGETAQDLYDSGQPGGVEYLRETIRFYGGDLGELTPPAERIKAQMAALEAQQTPRMVRGAALGLAEDVERLGEIEAAIDKLRVELAEIEPEDSHA
jgi:hypothetical protein